MNFFNQEKPIFKSISLGKSSPEYIWAGKIAALVAIGAGIYHFNENPVVISVMCILLSLLVITVFQNRIILYEDRLVFKTGPFIFSKNRNRIYYLEDINYVNCPVDFEIENLPGKRVYLNKIDSRDKLQIAFRNGENDLLSGIERNQLLLAARIINNQIRKLYNK